MDLSWAVALILVTVALGASGELLFKTGVGQVQNLDFTSIPGVLSSVVAILSNPVILLGFICYGVGAVCWIFVLSRLDLSYAYPMYALMYAIIPIAALVFLKEHIPAGRWVGILLIVAGVIVVFRVGNGA
ncbi:MAG TPA: EamA family transporter [Methanomicrobiales archaeon]|nr:EamA family transporter [Methanomicrobiales archaeon]